MPREALRARDDVAPPTATHPIPSRPPGPAALDAAALTRAGIAGWAARLGPPGPEAPRSRRLAHVGGVAAIAALVLYLTWRVLFTLPSGQWNLTVAWILLTFEALPLAGLVLKAWSVWNIDSHPPAPVTEAPNGMRVAVLIPTYNEPLEVLTPTVAAACQLEPAHETWVLDDGDRPWVEEMCAAYGARYVRREVHDHAKAGNMNHALGLMAAEKTAGAPGIDIIAVLDCDHVPLPGFLTATLGWFADPKVALIQGPQSFYNGGAFDDDGITGEQGTFFNVLMPSRNVPGAGPFWCGSTSLLRLSALEEVGGVATETITEDMHTTLKLIRRGWQTVYHHQTLAVGLAPATPDQYLLQRRRWGMGAMQILVHEKLWAAKGWMSWRNYHEYLNGTLWWLEGIATLVAFLIPVLIMLSGAQTSTAGPLVFLGVFVAMFTVRLWGSKQLMRNEIHWPTAFALRIFRVPVGLACLWWLLSRNVLEFQVTPKGAADARLRGRTPRILIVMVVLICGVLLYAAAGLAGLVPWRTSAGSTVASGAWLVLAGAVLVLGTRRIRAVEFATSRRNAYRVEVTAPVETDGVRGELLDISVGGAAVRFPQATLPGSGTILLRLPESDPVPLRVVRSTEQPDGSQIASLRAADGDWAAYRTLSLWIFHTPSGALPEFPPGVPAAASLRGR
ncbi:glycosyltransferase family 2 protein [Arthrobacter sp. Soil763]|uniref:glycosyltransferase family 2 protein n=1 Tax=Arthrobacter sp. Soil763 TaxID=1736402 RepID=UPI000B243F23|nr:glycosyltransferase family 2 protein [Arthrobacter sp. Soil763]